MDSDKSDKPEYPKNIKPAFGDIVGSITHPSCKVCNSIYRKTIEKMIVTPNISYREIVRSFSDEDISLNSVANHAKKHLNYADAAIQGIMEHEAQAMGEVVEEGVRGETAQRVFLSTFLQKAHEALLDDNLTLSGKEAMKAIEMLQEREEKAHRNELTKLQRQFTAYMNAMKELVPADLWHPIIERAKELYEPSHVVVNASVVDPPALES